MLIPEVGPKDTGVLVTLDAARAFLAACGASRDSEGKSVVAQGKVGTQVLYVAAPVTTTSSVLKLIGAAHVFTITHRISGPATGKRASATTVVAMSDSDILALAK